MGLLGGSIIGEIEMTTATINWVRVSDCPVRCVVENRGKKTSTVYIGEKRIKAPNNVVQLDNGYYHDRSHIVSESPGIEKDYTILMGKVCGRFGLSNEVFTGDSFGEALEKAKKKGALDIRRIF